MTEKYKMDKKCNGMQITVYEYDVKKATKDMLFSNLTRHVKEHCSSRSIRVTSQSDEEQQRPPNSYA